jgi:hypothetical protein
MPSLFAVNTSAGGGRWFRSKDLRSLWYCNCPTACCSAQSDDKATATVPDKPNLRNFGGDYHFSAIAAQQFHQPIDDSFMAEEIASAQAKIN